MDVRHDDRELSEMEIDRDYSGRWSFILDSFRTVMNLIRQVLNETELYQWKGLRLEKLSGDRSHQHSMRLNKQWRLIIEFEKRPGPNSNVCAVKAIEDYH